MMSLPMPDGFHAVTPYLIVKGADKLIDFLKRSFDGEEKDRGETADGKIRHAEVRLGDSIVELSEARDEWPAMQSAVHLYVRDADDCYRRALDAGAVSLYEPADMPYGERSAGVKDPCGNYWFIATYSGAKPR